jgi:hypothetical protein
MDFLSWWMLLLLPLALIPLLLHLLTLQRLRTVELPTFRFLFDTYVQQRRRMQFLEALLAFLRMLFILLLVVLFAGLVIKDWDGLFGGGSGAGGREVILLIDASASMNARSGGKSAFERAKKAALDVVEGLTPDDRITLVRVGARPEEMLSRFNTDTQGVKAKIDGLQVGSSRANLFRTLLHLFGPDAPKRVSPHVILFTDCQANSWNEVKNQPLEKLLPAGTSFTVVNVGPTEKPPNLALVGDAPRGNRGVVGMPVILRPRVVNYGSSESEVVLTVSIDGKQVGKPDRFVVKPNGTETRTIVYTPTRDGLERGRFEIRPQGPDAFPDDDRFDFVLSVQPQLNVLVVNGNPSDDHMQDEAFYLKMVLSSRPPTEDQKSEKPAAKVRRPREPIPQAALTAKELDGVSVVVLANCGALSDAQYELLRGFVREGGGLLILPGDKVSDAAYNTRFFPAPGPQGESLTDARLLPAAGDVEKSDTFAGLTFDFAHPALTVFADPKAKHFKTALIYRRFGIEVPKQARNARVVAVFARTDRPALVESSLGDGKVMLAAFPAHPRWGNLPFKPDFVPLILRLVSHLEHRPEADVPGVVTADAPAEVAVTAAWDPAEGQVVDPDKKRHPLKLERAGARLLAAFEHTSRRGDYEVTVRTTGSSVSKAATLGFAVNLAPEESDFTLVGEKEVGKMLPSGTELKFIDAAEMEQKGRSMKGKGNVVDLWGFLIVLVLAVITAEFLLATVGGAKRKEEGPTAGERVMDVATGAWVGRMTGAADREG